MIRKVIFSLILSSAVIVPGVSASTCSDEDLEEDRPIPSFMGTLNLAYVFKDGKTIFTKQEVMLPHNRITLPVDVVDAESKLVGLGVLLQGEHLQNEHDSSNVDASTSSSDLRDGTSKIYLGLNADQTLNWDQILYKFPKSFLKPTVSINFEPSEEFSNVIEMRMRVTDCSDLQYRSELVLLDLDRDNNRISDAVLQKYLTPEAVRESYCKEECLPLDVGSCLMRSVAEKGVELNGLSVSVKLLNLATTHSRSLNFDFSQLPFTWQSAHELSSGYIGPIYPLVDRVQFVLEYRSKDNTYYVIPSDRSAFSLENNSIDYAYAGVGFFLDVQESHMSLRARVDSVDIYDKGMFASTSKVKTEFPQIAWKLPLFDEETIAHYIDQETMGFRVIQRDEGASHH
ncbi:MAG: hypothetical protein ACTHJ4_05445 [Candidatus Nucleicultricaceae bacterium]